MQAEGKKVDRAEDNALLVCFGAAEAWGRGTRVMEARAAIGAQRCRPRCAQHVGLSWEPSRDAVLPDDCVDAKVGHEKSLEMVR